VTATAAKPVPTAAASESTGAWFSGPGLVHRQSPAAQLRTVQGRHGLIRISIHGHFDECETTSLTCVPVLHNLHSIHLTVCRKGGIQILLGRLERNVPDINVLQGVLLNSLPFAGRVEIQTS
jgi:hypothetical protein